MDLSSCTSTTELLSAAFCGSWRRIPPKVFLLCTFSNQTTIFQLCDFSYSCFRTEWRILYYQHHDSIFGRAPARAFLSLTLTWLILRGVCFRRGGEIHFCFLKITGNLYQINSVFYYPKISWYHLPVYWLAQFVYLLSLLSCCQIKDTEAPER